jgi:hypothetical protein
LSSVVFVIHEESGAVLAELRRDGRGRGSFPPEFYNKIGNNPNTQLNFELKPGFVIKSINTNIDNFKGIGNIVDEGMLRENLTEPLAEFRERLKVGRQVLADFNNENMLTSFEDPADSLQQQDNTLRNTLLVAGALLLI